MACLVKVLADQLIFNIVGLREVQGEARVKAWNRIHVVGGVFSSTSLVEGRISYLYKALSLSLSSTLVIEVSLRAYADILLLDL